MLFFLLAACTAPSASTPVGSILTDLNDSGTQDSAGDTGVQDSTGDQDSGVQDSGTPDSGVDSGADSGSPDTGSGGDTGAPSEDTSATEDTSGADTGASEPCLGIDSISPASYSVSSTSAYEEITITLSGCATGVRVDDNFQVDGGSTYTGTWVSVPTEVHGTATATLAFSGAAPHDGQMWFYVTSTQGDNDLFVLTMTP